MPKPESKLSVPVQGKSKVKLEDDSGEKFRLTYTKKQKLSRALRKAIDNFEKMAGTVLVEHGTLITDEGKVVYLEEGNSGSVYIDFTGHPEADTMSHIHPRDTNVAGGMSYLGGTFSVADIELFTHPLITQPNHRAAATEGTYWISRNPNMDASDKKKLLTAYKKYHNKVRGEYVQAARRLDKAITAGEITGDAYKESRSDAFNKFVVMKHNWLLEHQAKYNYSYGLEWRKTK